MNQKYYLLLVLVHIIAIQARIDNFDYLDFFEYCTALGYPVEDHIIPTEDHYNLRYFRIQAKNTKITPGKRVVYLQHGLTDSSDTWIVNEQHLAPGLILANQGFDVWVGNSRGNRYSNHKMSKVPLDFWDFSFHDMAMYDLPAAFTYITKVTNRKIHYIGHSQGTLIMFIALSQQLKIVSDNLLSFHAYGPVAYLKHQRSAILSNAVKTNLPDILNKSHLKWAFLFDKDGLRLNSQLCRVTPIVCIQMLKSVSETNVSVNNLKRLPVVFAHFPAGSSTKNIMHFQQFVKKAQFKQFDYGQRKNMKVYGQKTPPFYNLSKITFPVHLYVGKYDRLADPEDAQQLFNQLTNSAGKTKQLYDYGHATFIWGKSTIHVQDALSRINAIVQ